jgi:glycosyltransferase involved in cell wall biosynthesis
VILAVGRLVKQKGFDSLLEAFSSLVRPHPTWDLAILGEGEERIDLERRRHALGLDGRVFLPGKVGNVGDWYERADIFALSSNYEGFPNALAEAMGYGLPAVSYDCLTGPRDIIREGIDGYLVRPVGDAQCFASALRRLIEDDEMRRRMSLKAVEVRTRFSRSKILTQWNRVIESTW